MSSNAAAPPPVETWHAQNLRMVVFTEDTRVALNKDWWRDLTGAEPESSVRKKTEREDGGLFQGIQLVVSADLLRVQWTVAPPIDPDSSLDSDLTLGPYPQKRDWFLRLMEPGLSMLPPINRLAFLATLMQEVETREGAYQRLDQYLRHTEVHPEATDFSYRINRHRFPKVPLEGMDINCLATWSSGKVITSLSAQAGGSKREVEKNERHFAVLELDVNTSQDFKKVIPPENLTELLRNLVDIATDIAIRGDVRA